METRGGKNKQKKRSVAVTDEVVPETPSPKRPSVLPSDDDDDDSPKSVVATSKRLASVRKESTASEQRGNGDNEEEKSSDDVTDPVDLVGEEDTLKNEYDDMAASSPTAKHSLMMIMSKLPPKINIFRPPPPPHVFFVVYSHFCFFHTAAMKVLFAAFLWFEHESNNSTEANWPCKEIFVSAAESHDDMMSHPYLIDRAIVFLSAPQIGRPLVEFPAIKKPSATQSDIVTVSHASLRDVMQSKVDGSVASLRSDIMGQTSSMLTPTKSSRLSGVSLFQSPSSASAESSTIIPGSAASTPSATAGGSNSSAAIAKSPYAKSTSLSPVVHKALQISSDQIKKAAVAASTTSQTSLVFVRTPPLQDGNLIVGFVTMVEKYNKSSTVNKQHWGFKPGVIKQIMLIFSTNLPQFHGMEEIFQETVPAGILSTQFSRDQGARLVRRPPNSDQTYPYHCLTFVINAIGKVVSAETLFDMFVSKMEGGYKLSDFRSVYQQICDSGDLSSFGEVVRKKEDFWAAFKNVSTVVETNYLNKLLPDEDIVQLLNEHFNGADPFDWPPSVIAAAWKDGLPSEYLKRHD